MRIGIDVRYLSHGSVGGVHTYVANFVPALVDLAIEHQIYLYADTKRPFELQSLPSHVTLRLFPYRNALSTAYYDWFIKQEMERDQVDLAHFPANYGFGPSNAHTVITLHDAINILPLREIVRGHPKNPRTIATMTYLHFCTRAALPQADLVFTDSESAKCEITRHGKLDPRRIVPVPLAPTPDLRRIDDPNVLADVRRRCGLTRQFVLADAFKNPGVLVRAWCLLQADLRERYEIVFFARTQSVLPIVHEAVNAGHARLLVRPSREDLIALYCMAEAFVFPSWLEGFGIPILEAMTCGAPVIASDRGAIPEVVGDAALLSDAEDAETLARHIALVLGFPSEAQRLRARGYARAAQFSWQKTAAGILQGYHQALATSQSFPPRRSAFASR